MYQPASAKFLGTSIVLSGFSPSRISCELIPTEGIRTTAGVTAGGDVGNPVESAGAVGIVVGVAVGVVVVVTGSGEPRRRSRSRVSVRGSATCAGVNIRA